MKMDWGGGGGGVEVRREGDDHRWRRLYSEAFPGDTELVFIEFS